MELTPGYKRTEIGLLPENWELVPFADILDFRNGLNADKSAYGAGTPFANVFEIINKSHLQTADIPGRIRLPAALLESFRVLHGDTLFNRSSETQDEVGLAATYMGSDAIVFGGFVIRARPKNAAVLDPLYSGYALRATSVRKQIVARGQGAIRANVGQQDLRSVLFARPPLTEQRAIAGALSDVDALLGALDRLIAKKRDLKQASMQQLLRGRTRLPGFSCQWTTTSLGSVGRWFSGGTPSMLNEAFWIGDIPWVSPKDMKVSRIHDSIDHVGTSAIGNGTRLLPAGGILIVIRGMILAHSAPVARAERPVAFNQDIKGLVVNSDVDSNFALWWLIAHESLLLSTTNEATHGTKRIPTDDLFKLRIGLPSLAEQAAVALAITDMDAELTALEQRRKKTHLLKQGMMQALLTGRTRLV